MRCLKKPSRARNGGKPDAAARGAASRHSGKNVDSKWKFTSVTHSPPGTAFRCSMSLRFLLLLLKSLRVLLLLVPVLLLLALGEVVVCGGDVGDENDRQGGSRPRTLQPSAKTTRNEQIPRTRTMWRCKSERGAQGVAGSIRSRPRPRPVAESTVLIASSSRSGLTSHG